MNTNLLKAFHILSAELASEERGVARMKGDTRPVSHVRFAVNRAIERIENFNRGPAQVEGTIRNPKKPHFALVAAIELERKARSLAMYIPQKYESLDWRQQLLTLCDEFKEVYEQ